jgi:hypothetical protein
MANPEIMKTLSHLDRVNRGVVRIVSDPELLSMVTPTLLREISVLKREDDIPNTAYDLKDLLVRCPADIPRPRLENRHRLHQRLGRIFGEEDIYSADLENLDFPPPPIEGTRDIIPICSISELQNEGDVQHHCIGGYGRQIARGDSYAYRVVTPRERATALISPKWLLCKMTWVLDECRGKANAAVRQETIDLLNAWLATRQGLRLDEISLFSAIDQDLVVREDLPVIRDRQLYFEDLDETPF